MRLEVSLWDSALLPEGRVWSGPSSPRSDVRCSVTAASSLLHIVTNSDSKSSNKKSPRRTAGSTAEQRMWAPPLILAFSKNWERWGQNGRGGGLEKEKRFEKLAIFSAAVQQDGPEFTSSECQTHGEYGCEECGVTTHHRTWKLSWVLYWVFVFIFQSQSGTHTNKPGTLIYIREGGTHGTIEGNKNSRGRSLVESPPQSSVIIAKVRLKMPHCKQTRHTCQVHQFK